MYVKRDTLCWECKTPSPTCTWKKNLIPVEGWEAEQIRLRTQESRGKRCVAKHITSYKVKSCPLFTEKER